MIQKRVTHNLEHTQRLGELIEFVQQFRDDFPSQTSEQTFDRIQTCSERRRRSATRPKKCDTNQLSLAKGGK
jgi:hypothetical protein